MVCRGDEAPEILEVEQVTGYHREIEYFLSCVKDDRAPTVITPTEAKSALQVALAVREAAESGQIIEFP